MSAGGRTAGARGRRWDHRPGDGRGARRRRRRGHGPRGRRSARRQDPHVDVRRPGDRRRRRRVPRPHARGRRSGRTRRSRRSHVADRCNGRGVVRRPARHPRRDRARRPGGAGAVRHHRAVVVARQAARRVRAVPAAHVRRPTTCSAPTSGDASATRSTNASSTPSSGASTPPTPTTPASHAVPQLAELAAGGRSLLLTARSARARASRKPATGPLFAAPRWRRRRARRRHGRDGARRRVATSASSSPVVSIERDGATWVVDGERYDAIALTSPARATAPLLADVAPEAGRLLGRIEHADVIIVTMTVPGATWPERLRGMSGYLVPKPVQQLVTAASFGSQKWAHWRPADGSEILRVSTRARRARRRSPRRRRGRRRGSRRGRPSPGVRPAAVRRADLEMARCASRSTGPTTSTSSARSRPRSRRGSSSPEPATTGSGSQPASGRPDESPKSC